MVGVHGEHDAGDLPPQFAQYGHETQQLLLRRQGLCAGSGRFRPQIEDVGPFRMQAHGVGQPQILGIVRAAVIEGVRRQVDDAHNAKGGRGRHRPAPKTQPGAAPAGRLLRHMVIACAVRFHRCPAFCCPYRHRPAPPFRERVQPPCPPDPAPARNPRQERPSPACRWRPAAAGACSP